MTERPTAVVTGASGSIGGAVARRLARDGHRVILVGRRKSALDELADELGEQAVSLVADVTCAPWLDALAEVAPRVDVVVHSAAFYAGYGPLESLGESDWQRVFDVGPTAAMRLLRATLPSMKARGFGRIVLIGSLVGTLGAHGQAAYSAAKAALVGLARTVALEGGSRGVTANVVEPGLIDTPRIRGGLRPDALAALLSGTAAGRLGTVDEVAAVVGFLCRAEASFVTGAVLPVTGGLGLGLPRSLPPAG